MGEWQGACVCVQGACEQRGAGAHGACARPPRHGIPLALHCSLSQQLDAFQAMLAQADAPTMQLVSSSIAALAGEQEPAAGGEAAAASNAAATGIGESQQPKQGS